MTDYYVNPRSKDELKRLARSWRELLGIDDQEKPDVIWLVEVLLSNIFPHFALIPRPDHLLPTEFAVVSHTPTRIEVRDSVYLAARSGEPESRRKIIHELAHVVLHEHVLPKYFKDGPQERKLLETMSAEQQAEWFLVYFLMPEHITRRFTKIDVAAESCAVPYWLARKAFVEYGIPLQRRLLPYEVMALEDE